MRLYLEEAGWFRSRSLRLPVDKDGSPLPWFTYASILFLEERIRPDMRVFEYGSGNSTLWWSRRVSSVVSCEHDPKWYEMMRPRIPSGVEYCYRSLVQTDEYSRAVAAYTHAFDIVVIDGRDRVNCIMNSLGALTPRGVVIWDNSERPEYNEGYAYLLRNGFRRLDFHGLGPVNTYGWCTSIFYRPDNCLSL
jgi:hypothetical protein